MLNPNQVKVFLTNIQDFILTRGLFYSQKTYEGLEEFSNNLGETIIGKMLIPKEAIDKFREHNFKNEQKEVLWKQLEHGIIAKFYGELHHPPLSGPPLIKRLRLGYHLPCRHDMKAHLFQCCKTPQEFEDYLKNFTRLDDEFEEYFRRRKETGNKPELLVWNSIECYLNDARRAGNFDLEYQNWEPAIKAWEQRNNASFYGEWNWEDLLGKATLTWQEVFAINNYSVYTNSNLNINSNSLYKKPDSNLENSKSNNLNDNYYNPSLPAPELPTNGLPDSNKWNYSGGIFGVILVFLLVALVTVILTKRKRVK